jgi:DNA (cytosine-5)-methyltransferase 1
MKAVYTVEALADEEHAMVCEDISLAKSKVPKHDLLVGGFPCQDYSVARTKAQGIEGKKGVLWWSIRDIIENKRPNFVLLENVDRLLKSPTKQRGRDFGVILKCMHDLGYVLEWRVINAADYGHAQRRRRTFIFGARKDTPYAKSISGEKHEDVVFSKGFFQDQFKITDKPKEGSIAYDMGAFEDAKKVSDKFKAELNNSGYMDAKGIMKTFKVAPKTIPPKTLGEIVSETGGKFGEHLFINGGLDKWEFMKGAKKIKRTTKKGYKYNYSEGPMAFPDLLDKPSRTMLTSEGSINRSTHVVLDPVHKRLRILTAEECEDLNEFPRGWTDKGMPESWRYFMMGNALVVGVITKLGKTLSKISKM